MKATPFASASVLAGLASCLMAAVPAVAQPGALQPNIIHIVTDDLGWADVGFHDSDIKTPNLDQLAQTGARLRTVLRTASVYANARGPDDLDDVLKTSLAYIKADRDRAQSALDRINERSRRLQALTAAKSNGSAL